jgi:hypothetical protein
MVEPALSMPIGRYASNCLSSYSTRNYVPAAETIAELPRQSVNEALCERCQSWLVIIFCLFT